ncbi:MAG: CHAT domain-containing protein [Acidobacteria bacterium]|nr:MAG: CHAT domain-containing protein [Acidobacteriota bacterium]
MEDGLRPHAAGSAASPAPDPSAVDWTLVVHTGRVDGRETLHYSLTTRERALEDLGSVSLKLDLQDFLEGFLRDLARLPPLDADSRADVVSSMGTQLAEIVLPRRLRRRLRQQPPATTAQILSDETSIPWELLRIDSEGGDVYLGEAFAVARWRRGAATHLHLPLQRPALVVAGASDLPAIGEEGAALEGLLAESGRTVERLAPTYRQLTGALASGRFDAWHVAGHGAAAGGDPDRWSIQLEDAELTPRQLYGKAKTFARQRPPLVFLNCCHSGRGGQSLSGIGGWAERFLELGAGAFVGASWQTGDRPAKDFALAFYGHLLGGVAIAEAARRARLEVRRRYPGDPTWLAFAVYAHPAARCTPPPAARRPDEAEDRSPPPADPGALDAEEDAAPGGGRPGAGEGAGRGRLAVGLLAALAVVLALAWASRSGDEPPVGGDPGPATIEPPAPAPPPAQDPPAPGEAATSPGMPPAVELQPIAAGTLGVAVVEAETLAWNGPLARALRQRLREARPQLKPILLPAALRPAAGALRDGDLALFPGGDRAPFGLERVLVVYETHGPHAGARARFPTTSITCEAILLAARTPEVVSDRRYGHLGQGRTEADALAQAFDRCVEEVLNDLP